MKDILNTLKADGSFKTLLSLIELAGLGQQLHQPGPLTLFAPDDTAFTRVNVTEISREREALAALLRYHLTSGECSTAALDQEDHRITQNGKSLTVRKTGGRQMIDNAQIVKADIKCSNGVIHVVDNVFLPRFSGWYCGGCC